jgi:hypothetical protein
LPSRDLPAICSAFQRHESISGCNARNPDWSQAEARSAREDVLR